MYICIIGNTKRESMKDKRLQVLLLSTLGVSYLY